MGKGAYIKGARFEREVKNYLQDRGFAVIRASKSGVDGLSPDLVVLSSTLKFCLECKAWSNSLHFEKAKMEIMRSFEQKTGIMYYIAWKFPRREWRFFPLMALKETNNGYSLSSSELDFGITIEQLIGIDKPSLSEATTNVTELELHESGVVESDVNEVVITPIQ